MAPTNAQHAKCLQSIIYVVAQLRPSVTAAMLITCMHSRNAYLVGPGHHLCQGLASAAAALSVIVPDPRQLSVRAYASRDLGAAV
jgi:hypothetical protein